MACHLAYFGDDWTDVMQLVVFVVLTPKALCLCAQVCRAWRELAQVHVPAPLWASAVGCSVRVHGPRL